MMFNIQCVCTEQLHVSSPFLSSKMTRGPSGECQFSGHRKRANRRLAGFGYGSMLSQDDLKVVPMGLWFLD